MEDENSEELAEKQNNRKISVLEYKKPTYTGQYLIYLSKYQKRCTGSLVSFLNIFVHDMINLLYYECWIDKWKCFTFNDFSFKTALTIIVFNSAHFGFFLSCSTLYLSLWNLLQDHQQNLIMTLSYILHCQ